MSDPDYPVTLSLRGRRVLVVGGGAVAARRTAGLLVAGGLVEVIAPDAVSEIARLAAAGSVTWHRRSWSPSDLMEPSPAWFVHAATSDPAVNGIVAAQAEAERVWCVRADDARSTAAWTPAITRGEIGTAAAGITIAVTAGGDPGRACAVRNAVKAGLADGTLPVARTRIRLAS
ncbi:MAG: hypothetical protein KBB39_09835 [Phycicoccus sp.]|nr:hypothetical protein [Phycicoccus sp.]